MAIDDKEYAVGTQFRTSAQGIVLYEITQIRLLTAVGTVYELSLVGGNPQSRPPIWCTAEAILAHYPYMVPRPAPDPVDAPALVPAGDPAPRVILPQKSYEDALQSLRDVHRRLGNLKLLALQDDVEQAIGWLLD